MKHTIYRLSLFLVIPLFLSACSDSDSDGGGAESTDAPYLISAPEVSFVENSQIPGKYDVTVTIEANGPDGIYSATVFLNDMNSNNTFNFDFIDLTLVSGTTWTGTSSPMDPSDFQIASVTLDDADPFGTSFKLAMYTTALGFSTTHYQVDQRDIYDSPNFNLIAFGVSSIPITNFTIP